MTSVADPGLYIVQTSDGEWTDAFLVAAPSPDAATSTIKHSGRVKKCMPMNTMDEFLQRQQDETYWLGRRSPSRIIIFTADGYASALQKMAALGAFYGHPLPLHHARDAA